MFRRTITPFALLCLVGFASLTPVRAENVKDLAKSTKYLALGDSVAFGFTPLAPKPGDLKDYHGYPEIVSKGVHLQVANASCFGETTGHFLSLQAPDTGCQAWRAAFPLFAEYSTTQMDYAVAYLKESHKAELVTIDIGINDLGVLLKGCQGSPTCFAAGLPAVLASYQANLTTIFSRIRFEAGYTGPIVAVTIYTNDYTDLQTLGPISALNTVLAGVATVFHAQVADAFTAFGVASIPTGGNACTAGLLIPLPAGGCDIHPSAAGQALIAQTVLDLVSKK
jgi:lysophospholipase L1-like esterase